MYIYKYHGYIEIIVWKSPMILPLSHIHLIPSLGRSADHSAVQRYGGDHRVPWSHLEPLRYGTNMLFYH